MNIMESIPNLFWLAIGLALMVYSGVSIVKSIWKPVDTADSGRQPGEPVMDGDEAPSDDDEARRLWLETTGVVSPVEEARIYLAYGRRDDAVRILEFAAATGDKASADLLSSISAEPCPSPDPAVPGKTWEDRMLDAMERRRRAEADIESLLGERFHT